MRYAAPGVYVREVASGIRPISSIGTSTAAFVGTALNGAYLDEARAINNWSEFMRTYVGDERTTNLLAGAVAGFFQNGGSRCYIVNIADGAPLAGTTLRTGLQALDAIDDISILAAPGRTSPDDHQALLAHCEQEQRLDRVAILDPPETVDDIARLTEVATATAPAPGAGGGTEPSGSSPRSTGLRPPQSEFGALYFPWLVAPDPLTGATVTIPPSGHVAGIWARTDATRGVHKAPANESVRMATGLTYQVARQEQESLNPAGVNCIRYFPREGIKVWGARTLADQSSEFRYLNIRRLFIMLRESIAAGTRWIVFEPNDERLWNSITCNIRAFLTQVWRDGALMGNTPEQAFFVKCDAETNPPESRDEGQVVTVIGVAPIKPAEFVLFEITQHHPDAALESLGGRRG